jgi:hypothetical protein
MSKAKEKVMPGLGDGPVQPEYVSQMKDVARAIDAMFNGPLDGEQERTTGFILMVFPFEQKELAEGKQGRCNYMSNAARPDVVRMLKEQLKYFEGQDLGHETNVQKPKGSA